MAPQAKVGVIFLLVVVATSPVFGQRLVHSLEEASSSSSSADQQNAAAAASREFSDGNRHGKESSSSSSSSSSNNTAAASSRREVIALEGGHGRVDQGRFGGQQGKGSLTSTSDVGSIGNRRSTDSIESTTTRRLTEEEEKRRRIVSEEEDRKSTRRGNSNGSNGKGGKGKTVIINNYYYDRQGNRSGAKPQQPPQQAPKVEEPPKRTCPSDWTSVNRTSGVWCHKVYPTRKGTWNEAQAFCKTEGGHLSGFENEEEYAIMMKVAANVYKNTQVFLGARRRQECMNHSFPSYVSDKSNLCSRLNVIRWEDGASNNQEMILRHWSAENPDWAWKNENCLTWLFGLAYPIRPTPYYDGEFNDNQCDVRFPFICGKAA